MDFETLSKIRIENKNRSYFEVFTALNNDVFQNYELVSNQYHQHGLFSALKAILDIHDYYFLLPTHEKTNIDLFSDRLYDFEQKNGSSLIQYLNFLNQVEDQPTSEAISSSTLDDVVRIMTVHQSKGLQFPVVFFWSTFGTRIMDNLEKCMMDSSLGLGLMHIAQPYRIKRPTLQRMALEHRNTMEEFEENIRLLYVATTRPQTKLILVDQVKESYTASAANLAMLSAKKGFTDMLLSGMNQFQGYHRVLPIVVQAQKVDGTFHEFKSNTQIHRYQKSVVASSSQTPSSLEQRIVPELNLTGYHANVRGTQLHELVEHLPCAPWTKNQILSLAPDLSVSDCQKMLQLGCNEFFLSLQHQTIHKEFSFIVKNGDAISHGYIDYLAVNDQEVTLIDFKSDRHVNDEILVQRYADQINAYVLALHQLYPTHKISAYLYSFELNHMIKMNEH